MTFPTSNPSPTPLIDEAFIGRLRADLSAAEWTAASVEALLSPMAFGALRRDEMIPAVMGLEADTSAAAILTRLFVLAQPVPEKWVQLALPSLTPEGAKRLGLVRPTAPGTAEPRADRVEHCTLESNPAVAEAGVAEDARESEMLLAAVSLQPHKAQPLPQSQSEEARLHDGSGKASTLGAANWWVASDLSQAQTGEAPRGDYVLGIASASTNLARLTLRDPVDSALDLGCGCGVLALHLTQHARRVVATDISERACTFTRFNALLNEAPIEVRQGSFFEPVADEQFDLITSNPPFVITPQAVRGGGKLEYRDGGMERDQLIPWIIREAVGHLAPGGTLQMLANWEVHGAETGWAVRPKEWIERAASPALDCGQSVDAWLVQRDLLDVTQYAEWWMRDAKGPRVAPEEWGAEYREWLHDFGAAGTTFIGLGSLALHVGPIGREQENGNWPSVPARRQTATGTEPKDEAETGRRARSTPKPAGQLTVVCEYLPEGKPVDALAVRTALDNLTLPLHWETTPLVRAPDVREVRSFVPGRENPELIRITQGRAGGREHSVTSAVAALIGVSDGELSPAQVIPAIATLLVQDEADVCDEIERALPELLRSGVLQAATVEQVV